MSTICTLHDSSVSCLHIHHLLLSLLFSSTSSLDTQTSFVLCACFITMQTVGEAAKEALVFPPFLLCGVLKVGQKYMPISSRVYLLI